MIPMIVVFLSLLLLLKYTHTYQINNLNTFSNKINVRLRTSSEVSDLKESPALINRNRISSDSIMMIRSRI